MVVMEAVAMAVAAEEAMDMVITRASHKVRVMSMVIIRHDFSKSLDYVTPTRHIDIQFNRHIAIQFNSNLRGLNSIRT